MTAIEEDSVSEKYADVELLIYKTIHDFIRIYGGNFDELLGESHLMFMTAVRRYDNRSSFPTYVRWVVWHGLHELLRRTIRHSGKVTYMELDPNAFAAPPAFNLNELAESLSSDAQEVLRLVMDTPRELMKSIERRKGTGIAYRSVIRQYLVAIGWSPKRITNSFRELQEAL